ncbi:hypothetical protein KY285_033406 [Solanum tuberosum]|nr:hypothetical protein KY285_033406 [Solanum tuberosum]
MAFAVSVQCNNINSAEALAAEFAVKWCYHQGYTNFILKLNSMVIVDMVTNHDSNNRKMKHIIDNMLKIKNATNFEVKHCYRECNQVADSFTKLASIID